MMFGNWLAHLAIYEFNSLLLANLSHAEWNFRITPDIQCDHQDT